VKTERLGPAAMKLLQRIDREGGKLLELQIAAAGGRSPLLGLIGRGLVELADHPTVEDRNSGRKASALRITQAGRDELLATLAQQPLPKSAEAMLLDMQDGAAYGYMRGWRCSSYVYGPIGRRCTAAALALRDRGLIQWDAGKLGGDDVRLTEAGRAWTGPQP
jgi:hypothetical protein